MDLGAETGATTGMATLMTPAEYVALPRAEPDVRSRYGPHPAQFGELYLPDNAGASPLPVVVLLHGGCWRERFGLAPLGQLARALTGLGCAVWNLEFRRLGAGGGWPTTFRDAAAGIDFVRSLAEDQPLDPGHTVLAGHSAGGHLALWGAGRSNLPPDSELYEPVPLAVRGVISLAGIPDLVEAEQIGICGGAPAELMGGGVETYPERYRSGSPLHGPALRVPQWHVSGEGDILVPASYVEQCVARARARGEHSTLVEVPGAGHFEIITAGHAAFQPVEGAFREALAV